MAREAFYPIRSPRISRKTLRWSWICYVLLYVCSGAMQSVDILFARLYLAINLSTEKHCNSVHFYLFITRHYRAH